MSYRDEEKAPAADSCAQVGTYDHLVQGSAGAQYWEKVDADVNGMLGGFSSVSAIDLQGSRTFLARFGIGTKGGRKSVTSVVDAGAGIGRVTKNLLLPIAENVDVIEPVAKFTDRLKGIEGVRTVYNVGLEDWKPESVVYDFIWTQWCLNYLNDGQLIRYLEVCKTAIKPDGGIIFVKENRSTRDDDMFDEEDSSVTRTDERFRQLFAQAGLTVVRAENQRGMQEKGLLPVQMYALKP
ncbi:hypothetical protein VHEMI06914 [[Torrubiella] hemipterigena]|uniref:Alpha N-terminal protein methyltransferase 1 n=1 Tax=[Torrubiella] hemipterigena TaxID=1531966 RepID=A0A0A1T8V0_9HYPO|nr:hypothetical protein VHEMI06914 [[Torrubiella] hemipterigena]